MIFRIAHKNEGDDLSFACLVFSEIEVGYFYDKADYEGVEGYVHKLGNLFAVRRIRMNQI